MRVAHLADVHLGHRAFARTHPSGINVREADVVAAFRRAVDDVVRAKPDLVVIAGDFFDMPRPHNAIAHEAYRQLSRLAAAAPVVLVGGNHDAPRTAAHGNLLRLFGEIPGVHVVVDAPEVVQLAGVAVLAVPHGAGVGERALGRLLRSADTVSRLSGMRKLLVVHAAIQSKDGAVSYGERLPVELFAPGRWEYIAAGDYHVAAELAPNAWYSGSLEYVSSDIWSEARGGVPKGWLLADCSGRRVAVESRPVALNREVIDLTPIDAAGLTAEDLSRAVLDAAEGVCFGKGPTGHVLRQVVAGIHRALEEDLAWPAIRALKEHALHYQLVLQRPVRQRASLGIPQEEAAAPVRTLPDVLADFVANTWTAEAGIPRERVLASAAGFLSRTESAAGGA